MALFNAQGVPVNAEGLSIAHIDRIQVTLNPLLYLFINFKKRNIDPTNQLKLRYSWCYGLWWFLDIQAQRIDQRDIRLSIAMAIYKLYREGFLVLYLPHTFRPTIAYIYHHLDHFVSEVREIEFSFDFEPEAIRIIDPKAFIHCKKTLYSADYRKYKSRARRKSLVKIYDRNLRLKRVNQVSHKVIESNPFSMRIEFTLNKYNARNYRALNNLSGTYHDVIMRHIPYLGTVFYKHCYGKMLVNPQYHPYFALIQSESTKGKKRYTGTELERRTPHKSSEDEIKFYRLMCSKQLVARPMW